MELMSTAESAKILGVSAATIRNWARVGHLMPAATKPMGFNETDVLELKERIRSNRFNRLRKRANKSASDKFDITEIRDAKIANDINGFTSKLNLEYTNLHEVVFTAALYFLRDRGEAEVAEIGDFIDFDAIRWRRQAVKNVMQRWLDRNRGVIHQPWPDGVRAFLSWDHKDDQLGLLYQGLSSVGKKSRTGAFFTPADVIDESLTMFEETPTSFLDPCCGTGRYLLRAAERFNLAPENLHGFDSDPVAIDIACLNLLLFFPDFDAEPSIHCLDSLNDLANSKDDCPTNDLLGVIDAIATNPPWGGCKNHNRNRNLIELIKSGESFSLFLQKSLHLLKDGGRLSFLLPESVLKIRAHADIRRLLLDSTCITRIALLGKVFAGVSTPIIRLDLIKQPPPRDWQVHVLCGDRSHKTPQDRFRRNANLAFNVTVTESDARLIERIYSLPHHILRGNAEWALGIVTGDNSRCVLNSPCEGSEPILRGRDIFKFAPRPSRCHIVFDPSRFQQVAPERIYRAPEKLIYRFVSNRLIFAYDSEGRLTLNSANILIPQLPHMSIKACLAFLNSSVFQYLFLKLFQTLKILRGDLEALPFPILDEKTRAALEQQVDRCMGGDYEPADELDRMIHSVFQLSEGEIAMLEEGVKVDSARNFV